MVLPKIRTCGSGKDLLDDAYIKEFKEFSPFFVLAPIFNRHGQLIRVPVDFITLDKKI